MANFLLLRGQEYSLLLAFAALCCLSFRIACLTTSFLGLDQPCLLFPAVSVLGCSRCHLAFFIGWNSISYLKQRDVLLDPTHLYPPVVTGWGLILLLLTQLIQHSSVLGMCNLLLNYDNDDKYILVLYKFQIIVNFWSEVVM